MKIPQAQRTVQDVAPQLGKMNMMNVPTNVDMFGGAQAKQLAGLGADLNKFAQMGFKLGDELATTEAQEKLTQFQKDFAGWKVEAQKRRGKDGMSTGADYKSWSEGAMQALTKDMDGITRSKFMARAQQMDAQYGYWADSYGAGEEQAYKVTTQQAVIASNADLLALNIGDPELAEQSIMETMTAARTLAQMQGLGAEATKQLEQDAVRKALMPAIGSVIDSGNLRDAKAMMGQYSGLLGGVNMQKLNSAVQREGKRQAAEYRANQALARQEAVANETVYALGEYGDDLAGALEYVRTKYSDDLEMQAAIYGGISQQVRMQDAAEARSYEMQVEQEWDAAYKDGMNATSPQDASIARAKISNKENLERFDALMERRFANPNEQHYSDEAALQSLKDAVFDGKIKDPELVDRNYAAYVSTEDRDAMKKVIEKNKAAQDTNSLRDTFKVDLASNFDVGALSDAMGVTPSQYETGLYAEFEKFYFENFDKYATKREAMQEFMRAVTLKEDTFFFGGEVKAPTGGVSSLQRMDTSLIIPEPSRPSDLPAGAKWDAARGVWSYNGQIAKPR